MCIRSGADEAATVNNLISMALYALVAERLGVAMERLRPEQSLVRDWRTDAGFADALAEDIAAMFDGLWLRPERFPTLGELANGLIERYGPAIPVPAAASR